MYRVAIIRHVCDEREPLARHHQAKIERDDPLLPVSGTGRRSTFVSSGVDGSKNCGVRRPRAVLGEPRCAQQQLGKDRRTGVAAAKLAHLPLLGEHPQRVANLGPQRALEVLASAGEPPGDSMS